MNLGLENKVALVLASSKGLGFACAYGFYEEGANVVICSRSEENLKIAKEKIENMRSEKSKNKNCNGTGYSYSYQQRNIP